MQATPSANPRAALPRQYLYGISALTPTDAWAVGYRTAEQHAYAGHWDGARWRTSPLTSMDGWPDALSQVDASAPDDVWAIGPVSWAQGIPPVALHYDGHRWTRTPIVRRPRVQLNGLAVLAADDVWAVGQVGRGPKPFAEHWDGDSWSIVDAYTPRKDAGLRSIAAVAADDVWAVGWTHTTSSTHSLIVHWDGTRWQRVASPSPQPLTAVTALSTDDVWAAGSGRRVLHWDGSTWQRIDIPNRRDMGINSISAVAPDDVWAAGQYESSVNPRSYAVLMLHWDGASWTQVSVPGANQDLETLTTVSADAPDDAWTAGYGPDRSFIRHWDGAAWS